MADIGSAASFCGFVVGVVGVVSTGVRVAAWNGHLLLELPVDAVAG